MRPSRLLSLILARKHTVMPRPAKFQPREVTPEEAVTLAALSARGHYDSPEAVRARLKTNAALMGDIYRARIAYHDRDARETPGPMPDPCTWGAR